MDSPELADVVRRTNTLFTCIDEELEAGLALYRDLHANPELSGGEERTAGIVADRLGAMGLETTAGLGGHGVLGILRNGDGPVVGLRADMDALPVCEDTGLPYASTKVVAGAGGESVPVMHACGHDLHTTALVATAESLAANTDLWSGTVMVIAQPAEETMAGAAGMLADGLFSHHGKPDVVVGQHCTPSRVGMLHHRSGPVYSACRNLHIRIHGKGGHGAAPHWAIDPIPMAAQVVMALQTIPSRRIAPGEMSVVTVGSIHAGTRPNVIPEHVDMELTLRAHTDGTMETLVDEVTRIVTGVCAAGGSPADPEIRIVESTFATVNDDATSNRIAAVHRALFSPDDIVPFPVVNAGSEDFAFYGTPGPDRYEGTAVPTAMWFFGTTAAPLWDATTGDSLIDRIGQVPVQHTPYFAPDADPAVDRATKAMIAAALAFLAGPSPR